MRAMPDDLHSRLVVWLKVLLPLMALAILATLFLFSRQTKTEGLLPYAKVDLQELAREQRLTAPEFTGTTSDGSAVTIRARTAMPALTGSLATVDGVAVNYLAKTGTRVDLRAELGQLATDTNILTLTKGVQMETSTGYHIDAEDLTAALNETDVHTTNPVRAAAPFGTIDAGGLSLLPDPAVKNTYVLKFNNGVKLVYQPVN